MSAVEVVLQVVSFAVDAVNSYFNNYLPEKKRQARLKREREAAIKDMPPRENEP